MATNVSEKQAREVAEAARESEWKLPSFGKELFLGNFRLDLIHPQPRLDPQAVGKGERFLAQLREFLETEVDPLEIEREAKISDPVLEGLKRIGALGMKVSEEYGGLGLSQVYFGDILEPGGDLKTRAQAAVKAGRFYPRWLPQLVLGEGQKPGSFEEFGGLATYLRDDDAHHNAAERVLAGRYAWLEEGIADPSGEGPMIPEEVRQPAAAGAP